MYYDFISILVMSPSGTCMNDSLQSSYLPIILDYFPHIPISMSHQSLMLGFCMNPYTTHFGSSPPHGIYLYSIMFSQGTLRGKL
jgi:hypothetical protein